MKNHLEYLNHLNSINGLIDVEDFYSITFTKYEISFQGRYNPKTLSKYNGLFKFDIEPNGYICGSAKIDDISIRISLT